MDDEFLHQLRALKQHPVWQLLRERLQEVQKQEIDKFGRKILRGEHISPEETAEAKGRWKGILMVLDTPEWAETELRTRKEHEGS